MRNKIFTTVIFCLVGFSLFAANWKVKIRLINDTKDDIIAYVKQSDQMNSNQTVLLRVTLKIGQQIDTTILAKKYSILNGYATLNKGGKTDTSTILINENKLTFSPELSLPKNLTNENKPSLTDFTTSSKLLEFDPTVFMNKTSSPKPINELFNQYLGGLVICINTNGKDSIIDRVEPSELGSEIEPYYNSVEDKKEFYFTNQTDQKVKGSIPGIAELGVNFNSAKLYHLKIVYNGAGEVGWKNDNTIDINKNFVEKVGLQTHYKLAKYKIKYGDQLRVYQINKAYCFKGIYYQLTEMEKITENHTINGSVYFFNEGNYLNENKTTIERIIGSEFVGFWSELPIMFTELLDFSLSAYYNQQRNILATLPEDIVIKQYKEMVGDKSNQTNLTKPIILSYLNSYVLAYKTNNPKEAQNPLLRTESVIVNQNLNTLTTSEINTKYDLLNEEAKSTLPKDASIELKKKYLTIMKVE